MSVEEKDEGRGFVVIDKRGQEDESEQVEETVPAEEPVRALPKVDFGTFLLSLGTSALFHLGLVADSESGNKAEPNLPLARQTIDAIELLQEKTHGNLDEEEEKLLQNLLTELRIRFVEADK